MMNVHAIRAIYAFEMARTRRIFSRGSGRRLRRSGRPGVLVSRLLPPMPLKLPIRLALLFLPFAQVPAAQTFPEQGQRD